MKPKCTKCGSTLTWVSLITFHPKEPAVQHFKAVHGVDLTGDVDEYACEPCDQRCFVWRPGEKPSEPRESRRREREHP